MINYKVLIVEDNPLNMELATDVLEAAGYVVLQAEDAEAAIVLARSDKPALILMDVSLPGMDGLIATQALKHDPSTQDIPIVVLTAHAMQGDREKAQLAGCDGYLTKPINTKELPKVVAQVIQGATGT